ncbi:MAG: HPF/RaiA family ribosome-associated protein [Patescibacteria group bacterium]|nr:HPF/RaiA family ribosome-associated protein [Patescibacteria group bacterium]
MRIQIIGDGMEINDHIRDLIEDKLGSQLDKLLKDFDRDIKTAKVRIREHPEGYEVSFEMHLPGKKHIFAERVSDRLTLAFTELRESVERQLERYRGDLMYGR